MGDAPVALSEHEDFRVCIGIGFGEVLDAGHEGCFGNEVNVASKLGEDTAEPGEILLTQSAYETIEPTRQSLFTARSLEVSGVSIQYYHSQH